MGSLGNLRHSIRTTRLLLCVLILIALAVPNAVSTRQSCLWLSTASSTFASGHQHSRQDKTGEAAPDFFSPAILHETRSWMSELPPEEIAPSLSAVLPVLHPVILGRYYFRPPPSAVPQS